MHKPAGKTLPVLITKQSLLITPKIKEAGNKHLNFVPTSSSTMLVALGDAIAMTIAYKRKFKKENFGHFHPSGSLGKNLSPVTDIMKKGNDIPIVKENYSISKVILEISSKRLGCALVINKKKKIDELKSLTLKETVQLLKSLDLEFV